MNSFDFTYTSRRGVPVSPDERTSVEKRMDEIIALLKEIRDQGKAKAEKPPTIGPFLQ